MELKEALFWKEIENNVRCELCPHFCFLKEGETGKCKVRKNVSGKLVSLVYGKPCSLAIDPIEKKPLYHFLPGDKTLSIATAGCNLKCGFCQNWEISQCANVRSFNIKPEEVLKEALKNRTRIISYTYTEPTIFYEYMLDISKLAKKRKLRNVTVTNGFINPEPLKELCKYLDASNIDLKSFSDDFYERVCQGRLEPILNAIKIMKQQGVWIELTNLIIPGLNDSQEEITKLVKWIKSNLGSEIPVHFTAFYPQYKIVNIQRTSSETLKKARNIALALGLHYVYTGNIDDKEGNTTYCPKCNKALIVRKSFSVIENKIKNGKCFNCQEKIAGVWK